MAYHFILKNDSFYEFYLVGFINIARSLIFPSYVPTMISPALASQGPMFTENPSKDSVIHPSAVLAIILTFSVISSGATYHVRYPNYETATPTITITRKIVNFEFSNNVTNRK